MFWGALLKGVGVPPIWMPRGPARPSPASNAHLKNAHYWPGKQGGRLTPAGGLGANCNSLLARLSRKSPRAAGRRPSPAYGERSNRMAKEGEYCLELSPEFRDVFYIAGRIKQIDPAYYIMFNRNSCRYQVHAGEGKNSLQLDLPFDILDSRALNYVRQTAVSRINEYLAEIDKANMINERAAF